KLFGGKKTKYRTTSPRRRCRLSVEQLEDRLAPSAGNLTYAVMEIPQQGVFLHSSLGAWEHLTTADASQLAVNGSGDVAMQIAGQGVSLYHEATHSWQYPTSANASSLDLDDQGNLAMEIQGQG